MQNNCKCEINHDFDATYCKVCGLKVMVDKLLPLDLIAEIKGVTYKDLYNACKVRQTLPYFQDKKGAPIYVYESVIKKYFAGELNQSPLQKII